MSVCEELHKMFYFQITFTYQRSKMSFRTQLICDKNEKSQLENCKDKKVLLQLDCSEEKDTVSSRSERKLLRTKSKPHLEVSKHKNKPSYIRKFVRKFTGNTQELV